MSPNDFGLSWPDNTEGLSSNEASRRLQKYGRNVVSEKRPYCRAALLRALCGPLPLAMWVIIVLQFALFRNFAAAAILLVIQAVVCVVTTRDITRNLDAVAALTRSLQPRATVFRDGAWQQIDAALVVPGDKIKLASGSAVLADCTLNDHPTIAPRIVVDEAVLTGEDLPVPKVPRLDMVWMGSTVVQGEADATVQATGPRTQLGVTAQLLQRVDEPSESGSGNNIQDHVMRVASRFVMVAVLLIIACLIFILVLHPHADEAAGRFSGALLVVALPFAIGVVTKHSLSVGSKELSAKRVIVTRLSAIETMAAVNVLCLDKTGTLTLNKMEIQQDCPIFMTGENRESVLMYSALAAKWREPPRDALDTMLLGAAPLDHCDKYKQVAYKPFDPRSKRTEATLVGPDGVEFKVARGSPSVILDLCANARAIREGVEEVMAACDARGIRCLAVARTIEDDRWFLLGILTFSDPPRPDAADAIALARRHGIAVKMVTGDLISVATETARKLALGSNMETPAVLPRFPESGNFKAIPSTLGESFGTVVEQVDGFAQVHPEHKYLIVETLRQRGWTCAITGDGVGDAPTLKRAHVGIAVHGATDAARAASEMVLTEPGVAVIVDALLMARALYQRLIAIWIHYFSTSLQLLVFLAAAVFVSSPEDCGASNTDNFFRLPVLLIVLIVLQRDGALIVLGYDRVVLAKQTNTRAQCFIAAVLAGVACVSSLLLLWMSLDSIRDYEQSWYYMMGLPPSDYPHIISAMFLKISISDPLALFSVRTQSQPFFAYAPSKTLSVGVCALLATSTLVASLWPESSPDGILTIGLARLSDGQPSMTSQRLMPVFVWLYCVMWWFVQDWIKVLAYKIMEKYDIFGSCGASRKLTSPPSASTSPAPDATERAPLLSKVDLGTRPPLN